MKINKLKGLLIIAVIPLLTWRCSDDPQKELTAEVQSKSLKDAECSSCKSVPVKGYGWNLEWSDDFTGSSLDMNKWKIGYPWGSKTHNHKGYATKENAVVENGILKLYGGGGKHNDKYNTGVVSALKKIDFSDPNAEWLVEARMKLGTKNGVWPAFWLNSTGGWPNINEIDIMEQKGWGDQKKYETVMHFAVPKGKRPSQHRTVTGPNNLDYNWHTYSVAIKKNEVKTLFDGKTVNRVTGNKKDRLRKKTYNIILNLAIGGDWGGKGYQKWIDDFSQQSIYQIDYVAVYKK